MPVVQVYKLRSGILKYIMNLDAQEVKIRVVLADDHPVVRHGISSILTQDDAIELVDEATNGYEAQTLCETLLPDVLLLDLSMPRPGLTDFIAHIRKTSPTTKILVLSAHDDDAYVREVMKSGIEGYVLKEEAPDVVGQAIHKLYNGSTWFSQAIVDKILKWQFGTSGEEIDPQLTNREIDVVTLLATGIDNEAIASELGLAEQTIRNYVTIIYEKLDVHTRAEAVVWAIDNGYGKT